MWHIKAGLVLLGFPLLCLATEPPLTVNRATVAAACSSCHGKDPHGEAGIPTLTTQSRESLEQKLLAYRSGALTGTLMNRIARGFDEAELRAMARVLGTP